MRFTLSHTIPAAHPERVFDALVDPAILQRCIPGCESLVATGPDVYAAIVKIGVAGLKGSYTGTAAVTDRHRPFALRLVVDGKGGPGFVRGAASVALTAEPGATRIACDTDIQVGGLIAAVGSRLIDAAARKLAGDFFDRLSQEVTR